MTYRRAVWIAAILLIGSRPLLAGELYLEFLEGLRTRGYDDYALFYLEQLEAKDNLPAEIREVLDYEKAISLLDNARQARNVKTQEARLGEAEALLERFVEAHPSHPKASRAKTERARILFEKGRLASRRANSPSNRSQMDPLRRAARDQITQARALFQEVHDQLAAEWEQYKGFVDPDDVNRVQARDRVEADYIWSQIYLAQCSYEQASTYSDDSQQFKQWMSQAGQEFGKIHEVYRSQTAGLHARLWQGKCFEEQDEIGKALGIYNELLAHPGQSPIIRRIQDQALQFRLICLNHPQREDYTLVVDESTRWLNENRGKERTARGVGIRWERARALEKLSGGENLSETDRERFLQQALQDARDVNRAAGEYKDRSQQMIERVQVALGRDPTDPRDFDGAYNLALNMVSKLSAINQALKEIDDPAEKAELRTERDIGLSEAGRLLRLALDLAGDETESERINKARYMLAWVEFVSGDCYRSAVRSEYLARHYAADDLQLGLDAAFLSLAAWEQAYHEAPKDQRGPELARILAVGELMHDYWPDAGRTDEARMHVAQIFSAEGKPAQAAAWYSQIPESSTAYAAAQVAAGQAYWTSYLQAATANDSQGPSSEELQSWQEAAEQHLRTGIDKTEHEIAPSAPAPDPVIAGKVSLAQICINSGRYLQAIELLTQGTHAVMDAIQVADEKQRPASGIRSREFAGVCYQLLLRGYVGTQQIDRALAVMQQLERMAGAAGDEGVTTVYVQLGREIQKEIERLVAQQKTERLAEVRASFEQFLDELFNRKEAMTYSSLVWIAETYYGLGQGMQGENPTEAGAYFEKAAATYEDILARDDMPSGRELAVKLRLATCLRQRGRFDDALAWMTEVIAEKPNLLDAQFEAAAVLQDWGMSEGPSGSEKLIEAINGREQAGIWGWGQLSIRLQRILDSPHAQPEHRERFFEARYRIPSCRRRYALGLADSAAREQALQSAMQEIEAVAYLVADVNEEWKSRFNALYRDIQHDLGVASSAVADIQWPAGVRGRPLQPAESDETAIAHSAPSAVDADERAARPAANGQGSWGVVILGLIAAIAAAALFIYMFAGGNRRRPLHARLGPTAGSSSRTNIVTTTSGAKSSRSGKPRPREHGAAGAGANVPVTGKRRSRQTE